VLAIAVLAVRLSGTSGAPTATAPAARTANGDVVPSVRLHTTVGWVDGLATGLILPTDVSRLETQDPTMAKAVKAAWSYLTIGRTDKGLYDPGSGGN